MTRDDIRNWSNSNGLGYRSDMHDMYERLYMSAYMSGAAAEKERIAKKIEQPPFGDTAQSFAIWVRNDT